MKLMESTIIAMVLAVLAISAHGSEAPMEPIQAGEVLDKLKAGEPVEYDHVIVKGNLTLGQLDLPEEAIARIEDSSWWGVSEELMVINSSIRINDSIIDGELDFENAIFKRSVNLDNTTFLGPATFRGSRFNGSASFVRSNFKEDADFILSQFGSEAKFVRCIFNGTADFVDTSFDKGANFAESLFKEDAIFWLISDGSRFNGTADFGGSIFEGMAEFTSSNFNEDADFSASQFNSTATFAGASFREDADFSDTRFDDSVDFTESQFNESGDFSYSRFKEGIDFSRAEFEDGAFVSFSYSQFNGVAYFGKKTPPTLIEPAYSIPEPSYSENEDDMNATLPAFSESVRTERDWLSEGNSYYDEGSYESALECYDEAIALNPSAELWYNKGNALYKLERYI